MPFPVDPSIEENSQLRVPQRAAWTQIRTHFQSPGQEREVGIVLPVGCGKSGLIAITPFAVRAKRALIIAPGLRIRDQLAADMKASSETNCYERFVVLRADQDFPQTAVVESGRVNIDDFRRSDIVIANIHQIAGEENRWLDQLDPDFFDLLLIDEGHRNVADSWKQVKARFPNARIVNYSATPTRADGRLMEGRIIYSYPVVDAIAAGYVKRLRAQMLRPAALRYIDPADGQERVIGPDEVRALGESEAVFRRGIVMSQETLDSIVDCAIGQLRALRAETGEDRLKIIASALNQAHCKQITEAFRARNYRADYVHSNEGGQANDRILAKLERHELDVIVQARMLNEGFDHRYLAVAMVGAIYSNLAPFVQFVGRVMRAIKPGVPGHSLNKGVVVFHVGANVAARCDDFREYSRADREYFADMLPEIDVIDFGDDQLIEREPGAAGGLEPVQVLEQQDVRAAEMAPIGDAVLEDLLRQAAARGVTPEQAAQAIRRFRADPQDVREASRRALDDEVRNAVGQIFGKLKLKHKGRTLDPARRDDNYAWAISTLNRRVRTAAGGPRGELTIDQLGAARRALPDMARAFEEEIQLGL